MRIGNYHCAGRYARKTFGSRSQLWLSAGGKIKGAQSERQAKKPFGRPNVGIQAFYVSFDGPNFPGLRRLLRPFQNTVLLQNDVYLQ